VFDEAMGSYTAMISGMVAAAYDFSGMHEVIDVGGGDGIVCRRCPAMRYVVGVWEDVEIEMRTRHRARQGG
jgi:hypothetical protein